LHSKGSIRTDVLVAFHCKGNLKLGTGHGN
jgi:hypothetical protein